MKDFSQMTDEELDQAIIQRATSQPQEMDYSQLSDEELDNLIIQKSVDQETSAPQDRPVEAFAQGFGNAAAMGYLPQIQAATEPLIQGALDYFGGDDTDQKLKEQGFKIENTPDESYVQRRDRFIRQGQELAEENPLASAAGGVGGSIASGIATGGGLAKLMGSAGRTTSIGKRFMDAGKAGAITGAVRNPGDTEGEVDALQLEERGKNALQDAATGIVLQGGIEGAAKSGRFIRDASKNLGSWSRNKAIKATGAMLKDFRKIHGNDKADDLGQFIVDEGLLKYGDDVAKVSERADDALTTSGGNLDKIFSQADEVSNGKSGVNLKEFSQKYIAGLDEKLRGMAGKKKIISQVQDTLDEISEIADPSFSQLRAARRSIDDMINYSRANNELSGVQSELLRLRGALNDEIKEGMGRLGTELKDALIKENKRYSNIAEVAKMAADKTSRESANAAYGVRETAMGGAGAIVGSSIAGPAGAVVVGGLTGLATKTLRKYGTAFQAITANKVARALEKNQSALGKFSKPLIEAAQHPEKFVASVNLMMKDPEFKKSLKDVEIPIYRGPAKGKVSRGE